MPFIRDDSSDNDSDYNNHDPGREVIEKNIRNRLQRIADHTKDELNKVLKRVDTTLHNYDNSVQASLIQHGMSIESMSNVEHVADIKELEDLLNDSIAKQRYKQRLMIFIVGQTEQVSEKSKLLQQIGQFFYEQKQVFSGNEFNNYEEINAKPDEIDLALRSFDVKDCYVHVKRLGTRLNELNEEIIEYLIQNAGSKQQAKAKKKLAQAAKETREQLASLQSKLAMANNEMSERDNKIETLENEIDTLRSRAKMHEYKLQQYETEIEFCKTTITELEGQIEEYKNQVEELTKPTEQIVTEDAADSKTENEVEIETEQISDQPDVPEVQLTDIPDKEIQTIEQINSESIEDVSKLLNSTDEIDLNNVTIEDLQQRAFVRIRELLKESEMKESINNSTLLDLQQQFHEYKDACEQEQIELIEKADNAYQLQIKAQRTAEEAINHLRSYMAEQTTLIQIEKPELIHQETQTDELEPTESVTPSPEEVNPSPEEVTPTITRLSAHSKTTTDDLESIEQFRRESIKDKYITLIEEKKQELDQLKQQADIIHSRPTSIRPRVSLQSLETSAVLLKHYTSFSSMEGSDYKENQSNIQPIIIKQDQEQQTSPVNSRRSSAQIITQVIPSDQFKPPFFSLYEIIYKFRHSIINLLEQNELLSLANCLHLIKQLSSDENSYLTNDFIENAERVLKDIVKVIQSCISTFQTTINEYRLKDKTMMNESELILDTSLINQQSAILEQKESILIDLKSKYDQLSKLLNETNMKFEEESNENQRVIQDQEKVIENLQHDLARLQKRLIKIETQGIIEPSIMFTRLDAEQNEQTLQQAVYKGKVSETAYNELNETMSDYVALPSQQLSNLVKRYVQFRRAAEIENRIQREILDNDTKTLLEKMESLHERRSAQMGRRMTNIRQQRSSLAQVLTDKFDQLEDECSIFLIRPVYSYQGRAAAQSYMKYEKRRREAFLQANLAKRKHNPSRQSGKPGSINNQKILTPISSLSGSDEEQRLFRIDKSRPSSRTSGQQNSKQGFAKAGELTRLQEIDIQRTLMPTSHASTTLLSAFSNDAVDPCVPSLNLRSYVALSRPNVGNLRMEKSHEIISPLSREGFSVTSGKSRATNPRTPYNSSAGDARRTNPSLPLIRRAMNSSVATVVNERQHTGFVQPNSTNEISVAE